MAFRITNLFVLTKFRDNTRHNTLDIKTNIVERLLKFKTSILLQIMKCNFLIEIYVITPIVIAQMSLCFKWG